jgi:tRNA nucleotidyltransferase (CCA-adding enzyme)
MKIPEEIKNLIKIIEDNGFEAYIVGGCVRDLMINKLKINNNDYKEPDDWDVATNAYPEKIQEIFRKKDFKTFYENEFGTVGVVLPCNLKRNFSSVVEITTYRTESCYTDKRHPDKISWAKKIQEDLSRRDFTVNAMALKIDFKEKESTLIIDPFNGADDLKNKIIKSVGDPKKRFSEDALRMMRAVRFATKLNFKIEKKTREAIIESSFLLDKISKERIRDEFIKIIMTTKAANGIDLLRELKILKYIIPELEDGYGVEQNKHHVYDCYQHNILSLDYAAKKNFSMNVRVAALLHDIAKPKVKKGKGLSATFYGHEIVGAKMAKNILERLKFPKEDLKKIINLIRYHLFYYNVGEVSESSVRRLVR